MMMMVMMRRSGVLHVLLVGRECLLRRAEVAALQGALQRGEILRRLALSRSVSGCGRAGRCSRVSRLSSRLIVGIAVVGVMVCASGAAHVLSERGERLLRAGEVAGLQSALEGLKILGERTAWLR